MELCGGSPPPSQCGGKGPFSVSGASWSGPASWLSGCPFKRRSGAPSWQSWSPRRIKDRRHRSTKEPYSPGEWVRVTLHLRRKKKKVHKDRK